MEKKNDAKYQRLYGSEQDKQINPIEGEIHNTVSDDNSRLECPLKTGMPDKNRQKIEFSDLHFIWTIFIRFSGRKAFMSYFALP